LKEPETDSSEFPENNFMQLSTFLQAGDPDHQSGPEYVEQFGALRWSCSGPLFAFFINIFGIEIDAAVPLNGVECNVDSIEFVQILDALENAEVKQRLHVEPATLPIFENDRKSVVLMGNDLLNGMIHRNAPYCSG
jgi:hypothetical protein